ncbi:MBL fold metallo-hydrolase [bacterium SCSIO 12741]|nr:MBL fold metallo-hydrolase [bacterium SCSIO 12741]
MKKVSSLLALVIVLWSCSTSTKTQFKAIDIQLIRNATLKVNYNGSTFLVDPSLSAKQSFMSFVVPDQNLNPTVDLPLAINQITEGVNAVLVTHTHLDHFDAAAEKNLDSNLPLFAQPSDQERLSQSPFKNVHFVESETQFEGTQIIRTSGKHGPEQLLEALGEVSGFILQAEGHPTLYIIGDCLWDDEVKATIKEFNPDIIVANTGGAQYGGGQILMNENDAIELAQFAPHAQVIAVHMEALDHCQTTRAKVTKAAKEAGVEIRVPADGERITLSL